MYMLMCPHIKPYSMLFNNTYGYINKMYNIDE